MTTNSTHQTEQPVGCGFWLLWIVASVAGTASGWPAGWWVTFQVPGELATLVLGLPVGFLVGTMQWLVLRKHLANAGWWVPVSTLGWGLGFFIGVQVAYLSNLAEIGFGLAVGAAVGLSSGVLQWLVLRKKSPSASWWILASTFSWTAALIIYQSNISAIGIFYGLIVGIVTGWVLIGLLGKIEAES